MTSSRHTNIPIEHVKAELATFPFASEAALNLATTKLCPRLSGGTGTLWRKAENMLVTSFPGNSVDEAVAIRDHLWFSKNQVTPLHTYLETIANDFLQPQGFIATPKLPTCLFPDGMDDRQSKPLAHQAWWWLSMSLPVDFLLAALQGIKGGHQPDRVETVSPLISQQLLDHGYAETHLHMRVGLDFRSLWTSALIAVASPDFKQHAFHSPSALLDEGKQLASWLIRAAIVRYLLAGYLRYRQENNECKNLSDFIAGFTRKSISKQGKGEGHYTSLLYVITELQQGQLNFSDNFVNLQSLYRDFTGLPLRSKIDSIKELGDADPIATLFTEQQRGQVPIDIFYIHKSLSYLNECDHINAKDSLFETLFWQSLRVQALLHRHTIQRPLTRGLQWFLRFYSRSSPIRQPLSDQFNLQSAAKLCGLSKGLKSLEVRVGPENNISDFLKLFSECNSAIKIINKDLANKKQQLVEVGLVLHFVKYRGGDGDKGLHSVKNRETHAAPNYRQQGFRFSLFYKEKQREAMALSWVLNHFPDTLKLLRGLDVCTDELAVPNWILAPLLLELRELSRLTSISLRELTEEEVPPLGMTAHTGEDFIHLLTGLRYIDQTIEAFKLTQGDRLGHCIALGVDPAIWARSISRVAIPKEERLFDLLWVWTKHGATQWWKDGNISMEFQLTELINELFTNSVDKFQLCTLMEDLHDSQRLKDVGFPDGSLNISLKGDRNKLLHNYLTNKTLFQRGQELVWIEPESESNLLVNIQNELRKKIGVLGLTIEVNPSSNQLIGDFGDLKSHPLWRLFPPIPLDNVPPVSICIGSDDPLIFSSDLRQEYQRVYDALITAGLSEQQASKWMNQVRENGLKSRFTLPV